MSELAERCFGCQSQIAEGEPRIHVGLDEWAHHEGLEAGFGLDDLLMFPFCEDCCEQHPNGRWSYEYEARTR